MLTNMLISLVLLCVSISTGYDSDKALEFMQSCKMLCQ